MATRKKSKELALYFHPTDHAKAIRKKVTDAMDLIADSGNVIKAATFTVVPALASLERTITPLPRLRQPRTPRAVRASRHVPIPTMSVNTSGNVGLPDVGEAVRST